MQMWPNVPLSPVLVSVSLPAQPTLSVQAGGSAAQTAADKPATYQVDKCLNIETVQPNNREIHSGLYACVFMRFVTPMEFNPYITCNVYLCVDSRVLAERDYNLYVS